MESKEVNVNVFSPLWQGKNVIKAIQYDIQSLRWSSRVVGSYWDGGFSIRAPWTEQVDWLNNGLGRHVEIKDNNLTTVWEGFVVKLLSFI